MGDEPAQFDTRQRQAVAMEGEGEAGDRQHPHPEGARGDRDHAGDVAAGEAGGGIDAVARRSAGDQRQAEIVADRIAGEGGERRGSPGQWSADHAQREDIVEGQRDIAGDGAADGEDDLAWTDRLQRRRDVAGPQHVGELVERGDAESGQQGEDGDGEDGAPVAQPIDQLMHWAPFRCAARSGTCRRSRRSGSP